MRAVSADGTVLVDQTFPAEQVSDRARRDEETGAWLRETQEIDPMAVGHRVVHGGPDYGQPILVDAEILATLER